MTRPLVGISHGLPDSILVSAIILASLVDNVSQNPSPSLVQWVG